MICGDISNIFQKVNAITDVNSAMQWCEGAELYRLDILLILQSILRMEYARGNDSEFNKRLTAQFIVNNPQDWSALKLNRLAGECSIEDGKLHCQILKIVVQQYSSRRYNIFQYWLLAPG